MNAVPTPAVTRNNIRPKPKQMPSMCGMPRRMPTFAPVAVSMTLFGPGVMEVTMENTK